MAATSCPILLDIVGARWLPLEDMDTFCVVQYGARKIHRTRAFAPTLSGAARVSRALRFHRLFGGDGAATRERLAQRSLQNPIWTVREDSLCSFAMTRSAWSNHKPLTVSVWARGRPANFGGRSKQNKAADANLLGRGVAFVGKVQLSSREVFRHASTEERVECSLVDDLGKGIASSSWDDKPVLVLRFRVASAADVAFANHWNRQPRPFKLRQLLTLGQLVKADPQSTVTTATGDHSLLVTERPEHQVRGALIATALKTSMSTLKRGRIPVKPYPDPDLPAHQTARLTPVEIERNVTLPSKKWIRAGTRAASLGRAYLEVLSCRGLPNVDTGPGHHTAAFCAVVYGDAMVQTDVIEGEVSPRWMPWTQRAFVLEWQHPSQVLYVGE